MNRRYTSDEFEKKCQILREEFDQPALTTDVIVGFPGETETEYATTVDFLTRVGLYETHIFKYSTQTGDESGSDAGSDSGAGKGRTQRPSDRAR